MKGLRFSHLQKYVGRSLHIRYSDFRNKDEYLGISTSDGLILSPDNLRTLSSLEEINISTLLLFRIPEAIEFDRLEKAEKMLILPGSLTRGHTLTVNHPRFERKEGRLIICGNEDMDCLKVRILDEIAAVTIRMLVDHIIPDD